MARFRPCAGYSNILLTVSGLPSTMVPTKEVQGTTIRTRGEAADVTVDLVEMPTADEQLTYPINRAEMALVGYLSTVGDSRRSSVALACRGRGRGEARRFAHSGELAVRMPDLFAVVCSDGRISVEHLDRVWLSVNRYVRTLDPDVIDNVLRELDVAVENALLNWLDETNPSSPVAVDTLSMLADEVVNVLAADLVSDTEESEVDSASVIRKDNRIILDCGSSAVASRVWKGLNDTAWTGLQELKKTETVDDIRRTLSTFRADVLLRALGDDPENITVTVNLYRTTADGVSGYGAGFIPGVGWISSGSADFLEALASTKRTIPSPEKMPETESYRFPVKPRAYMVGRDAHCRFPFCTVPADQCEFDHIENSPHTDPTSNGATAVTNGQCLCRLHHRLKTLKLWQCRTEDGGFIIHWTGPDGRQYTTVADGPLTRIRTDGPPKSAPSDPDAGAHTPGETPGPGATPGVFHVEHAESPPPGGHPGHRPPPESDPDESPSPPRGAPEESPPRHCE